MKRSKLVPQKRSAELNVEQNVGFLGRRFQCTIEHREGIAFSHRDVQQIEVPVTEGHGELMVGGTEERAVDAVPPNSQQDLETLDEQLANLAWRAWDDSCLTWQQYDDLRSVVCWADAKEQHRRNRWRYTCEAQRRRLEAALFGMEKFDLKAVPSEEGGVNHGLNIAKALERVQLVFVSGP